MTNSSGVRVQSSEFRNNIKYVILMLFLICQCGFAVTDEVSVQTNVSKTEITIGDRIDYTIKLTYPENMKIQPPERTMEIGNWEVKDIRSNTENAPGKQVLNFTYTLVTFSTGQIKIPELIFKYNDEKGKTNEIKTQPYDITIKSMLDKYGAKGLRDIKPPVKLRLGLSDYYPWLLVLFILIVGFGVWYHLYLKRRQAELIEALKPKIPPHIIALEALEKLKNSGLTQEGKIKEYYIALSDIIRDYVSGVYEIETRDRTTGEIYQDLKKKVHDKRALNSYKDFFEGCDLVKFAKYRPDEKTADSDWLTAKTIVSPS